MCASVASATQGGACVAGPRPAWKRKPTDANDVPTDAARSCAWMAREVIFLAMACLVF